MRVKCHQIRAKVAFTKPLTTHLLHGKGDFSCRGEKCIIKQLLNSFSHDIMNYQNLVSDFGFYNS